MNALSFQRKPQRHCQHHPQRQNDPTISQVEYANDLSTTDVGSGFPVSSNIRMDREFDRTRPCQFGVPEYYLTCGWNLNNLPSFPGSVLRHFGPTISGLTSPWCVCCRVGSRRAGWCWVVFLSCESVCLPVFSLDNMFVLSQPLSVVHA